VRLSRASLYSPKNIRTGWKVRPKTNALAYLASLSATKKTRFMILTP